MYSRVRSKICGIRTLEDALCAIHAGADALGFVFYKPSPRYVSPEDAKVICEALPPFVEKVGLFVDHSSEQIRDVLDQVPLSLLQFHGQESEAECLGYDKPYIKAIRVRNCEDIVLAQTAYQSAQALLLDAYHPEKPGGTGESFDWDLLPEHSNLPVILAGGLRPENVRKAIQLVHPYAVDVSGGVESAKGIKDHAKIKKFIQEVSRDC